MRWATVVWLMGCNGPAERAPGPHADDEGAVTYWEVVGSTAGGFDCTDSDTWADVVTAEPFATGSFFTYRVESGGSSATGQSCATTDPASCADSDARYEVLEHELVWAAPEEVVPVVDQECDLVLEPMWTLRDGGETGTFTLDIPFVWRPPGAVCADYDAAIADEAPNGLGLGDCVVQVVADLVLYQIAP